ncbi:hypothetical protein CC2G_013772 [Coprinopsis cinerea AmutBmut pab1-1]|nr:hypothetical protein CC2G_013772 [Coprinopsis cinerea AmutBmut pab1-1]
MTIPTDLKPSLDTLPVELITEIAEILPRDEGKHLRLVCKDLAYALEGFTIARVKLSFGKGPQMFLDILDHLKQGGRLSFVTRALHIATCDLRYGTLSATDLLSGLRFIIKSLKNLDEFAWTGGTRSNRFDGLGNGIWVDLLQDPSLHPSLHRLRHITLHGSELFLQATIPLVEILSLLASLSVDLTITRGDREQWAEETLQFFESVRGLVGRSALTLESLALSTGNVEDIIQLGSPVLQGLPRLSSLRLGSLFTFHADPLPQSYPYRLLPALSELVLASPLDRDVKDPKKKHLIWHLLHRAGIKLRTLRAVVVFPLHSIVTDFLTSFEGLEDLSVILYGGSWSAAAPLSSMETLFKDTVYHHHASLRRLEVYDAVVGAMRRHREVYCLDDLVKDLFSNPYERLEELTIFFNPPAKWLQEPDDVMDPTNLLEGVMTYCPSIQQINIRVANTDHRQEAADKVIWHHLNGTQPQLGGQPDCTQPGAKTDSATPEQVDWWNEVEATDLEERPYDPFEDADALEVLFEELEFFEYDQFSRYWSESGWTSMRQRIRDYRYHGVGDRKLPLLAVWRERWVPVWEEDKSLDLGTPGGESGSERPGERVQRYVSVNNVESFLPWYLGW